MPGSKSKKTRRAFLRNAALAGAATGLPAVSKSATSVAAEDSQVRGAAPPAAEQLAMEASTPQTQPLSNTINEAATFGSDFMIDVLKSLDLGYVFSNPGSSFLGLHESITTYGGNERPEFITCMHEESAAAHGERLLQGRLETRRDHVSRHRGSAACRDEFV